MKIEIRKGKNGLQLALDEISKSATVKDDRVSYQGFSYTYFEPIILGSVHINGLDDPRAKARLIRQAIHGCARKTVWTIDEFRAQLSRHINSHYRRKVSVFVFYTTVSLPRFASFTRRFQGVSISSGVTARKGWASFVNLVEQEARSFHLPLPNSYAPVKILVRERSETEALHRAEEKLMYLRGVWNLGVNRKTSMRMSSGFVKPVNQILPGPFIISASVGSEARVWHIPETRTYLEESSRSFSDQKKWNSALAFEKGFRRKEARCRYAESVRRAINQYCAALDCNDFDISFLRLWGVLENLIIPGRNKNYDLLISRCSFLFKDFEFVESLLGVFKEIRNSYVHESKEFDESENCLYQLKNIVEIVIEFHVGNKKGFESLEDACEFFDLPREEPKIDILIQELKCRIRNLEYAKKFLSS